MRNPAAVGAGPRERLKQAGGARGPGVLGLFPPQGSGNRDREAASRRQALVTRESSELILLGQHGGKLSGKD